MGVQVAIVGPLAILLLWAAHVFLLNQPVGRGLAYGVFWGDPGDGRDRRRHALRARPPAGRQALESGRRPARSALAVKTRA